MNVQSWIVPRHAALLPLYLPGVIELNGKVHRYIRSTVKDSIDTASSIIMIFLLILIAIFASVFCAVEIYSETITVVQLGKDLINHTLSHKPELVDIFPNGKCDIPNFFLDFESDLIIEEIFFVQALNTRSTISW